MGSSRYARVPRGARRTGAWRWLALTLAGAGALVTAASVAEADTGKVSPLHQGYSTPSSATDPYANDNPKDVHVDGFGGQPTVNGEVVLNLDSLPANSTIEGMQLQMTPNSSSTDNVNASGASVEACPLDQPITSDGYQSPSPTYDCNAVHAVGEPQTDGRWFFDITPIAQRWQKLQNTGLAIVAFPPQNDTGQAVSPSAWALGFDSTKTVATVDYTKGSGSTSFTVSGPPASSGSGSSTPVFPAVQPPPIAPAPAVSAPAASSAPASATPSSAASTSPAAPVGPGLGTVRPPVASRGEWLWFAIALFGAAALMLIVGAGQQVLRGGAAGLGARMVGALSSSRSQLATPIAVLALAGVSALGFTGAVASAGAGGGGAGIASTSGGGGAGGSGGSSGSASGGAAPASPGASGAGTGTAGPGAPGGASGGGGGGGASGAAATAANDNGQDGPGVTHTTVRVGFIYVTNQQAANSAFGVQVASPGNEQSEEQALVTYINAHGGVAGRQIQPVYVAYDNAQADSNPNIGEQICKTLTEDYHVWAVVGGAGPPDDQATNQCYASHGTLNFDLEASENSTSSLKSLSPYIWDVEDSTLDRTMTWEISGLRSRGFFSSSAAFKLGVVVAGDPTNDSVYKSVTLPAIEAAGVSSGSVIEAPIPYSTLDQAANAMKQAVITFQAQNVTNVMFQGGSADGIGSFAILFMLNAESQHFAPRYGLSSDDGPGALQTNIPQDQLNGALAVGESAALDTDDAHYHPYPYGKDQTQCNSIESAAGNTSSSQQAAGAVNSYCDAMFDMQQAAQPLTGGPLNAQLWADQLMKMGSGLFDAQLYARAYAAGRWDGAGGYRLLHAVQNCEGSNACFEYDNGNVYS